MSHRITLTGNKTSNTYSFVYPDDRIGSGSVSVVYKAVRDDGLRVAIKVLKSTHVNNDYLRSFFYNNALISVSNPHLMQVYDHIITEEGGNLRYHLVMEYIEGESFDLLISRRLSRSAIISYIMQLVDGLGAMHKHYIHCDLKPSNLIVAKGDYLKITDFDTALVLDSASRHASFVGTPLFSSPEQINVEPLDVTSDLWSVGVIFYYCLTGYYPFGNSAMSTEDKKAAVVGGQADYDKITNSDDREVIKRLLHTDRTQRFQTALEVNNALEELLTPIVKHEDRFVWTTSKVLMIVVNVLLLLSIILIIITR